MWLSFGQWGVAQREVRNFWIAFFVRRLLVLSFLFFPLRKPSWGGTPPTMGFTVIGTEKQQDRRNSEQSWVTRLPWTDCLLWIVMSREKEISVMFESLYFGIFVTAASPIPNAEIWDAALTKKSKICGLGLAVGQCERTADAGRQKAGALPAQQQICKSPCCNNLEGRPCNLPLGFLHLAMRISPVAKIWWRVPPSHLAYCFGLSQGSHH